MSPNEYGPVRILQVVGGLNRAGTETWLMHVLRNIDRDRFQMDFLVHTEGPDDYEEEILELGGGVLRVPEHNRLPSYTRRLWQVYRESGPYDVVHSHVNNFSGIVLPMARMAGVPIRIAHSHNDTSAQQRSARVHRKAYYWVTRSLINRSLTNGLAASCVAGQALFGRAWASSVKYQTLYCGIDLSPFRYDQGPKIKREQFGIPDDAVVVGHVGSFTAQKNHRFLLEAARRLVTAKPDVYVLLIGEGPLKQEAQAMVRREGLDAHIMFLGQRSDVPTIMRDVMDVFVLPSLHEGLPLVGMEAQAAGLKVYLADTITPEAVIVPSLVEYLPIKEPMEWAQRLQSFRRDETQHPSTAKAAWMSVYESQFNILNGIHALGKLYASS